MSSGLGEILSLFGVLLKCASSQSALLMPLDSPGSTGASQLSASALQISGSCWSMDKSSSPMG